MLIDRTYYGDVVIKSDLPFNLQATTRINELVKKEYGEHVASWPMTIEYNDQTWLWELWFLRPVDDTEYEAV